MLRKTDKLNKISMNILNLIIYKTYVEIYYKGDFEIREKNTLKCMMLEY